MIVWALALPTLLSHRNWTRKVSIADGVVSGADPQLLCAVTVWSFDSPLRHNLKLCAQRKLVSQSDHTGGKLLNPVES